MTRFSSIWSSLNKYFIRIPDRVCTGAGIFLKRICLKYFCFFVHTIQKL